MFAGHDIEGWGFHLLTSDSEEQLRAGFLISHFCLQLVDVILHEAMSSTPMGKVGTQIPGPGLVRVFIVAETSVNQCQDAAVRVIACLLSFSDTSMCYQDDTALRSWVWWSWSSFSGAVVFVHRCCSCSLPSSLNGGFPSRVLTGL